jgi:hypothetical protein
MKKISVILAFVLLGACAYAQVGVRNTDPKAVLDIKASNQGTPLYTDGILVPRIAAFPATNPGVDQTGMLIYLTTTNGPDTPGFYYWDNGWYKLNSGAPPVIFPTTPAIQCFNLNTSDSLTGPNTNPVVIRWTGEDVTDPVFDHSSSTQIKFTLDDAIYEISYTLNMEAPWLNNACIPVQSRVRMNGATYLSRGKSYNTPFNRNFNGLETEVRYVTLSPSSFLYRFVKDDYLEVIVNKETATDGTVRTILNESYISVKLIKEL